MTTIILDNGHGNNTPGKRSPVWLGGRQLLEWEFNRDMVWRIAEKCRKAGIRVVKLVPEMYDVPLDVRCVRANNIYRQDTNCVLVSIHANAGGGTGFEVFTTKGETKADPIATKMIEQLQMDFPDIKMRTDFSDGDPDKESDFYILKYTIAPAILVENLFMDNENDCAKLLSAKFRDRLADSYVKLFNTIAK